MKFSSFIIACTLLLLPVLSLAGYPDDSITLGVAHSFSVPLGGTRSSNLSEVDYFSTEIVLSHTMLRRGPYRLTPGIGLRGFIFTEPEEAKGFGATPFVELKASAGEITTGIEPYLFGATGVGIVDVHHGWGTQDDGQIFLLEIGVGASLDQAEARVSLHHFSNGGLHQDNAGINSIKFSIHYPFEIP